MKQRTKTATATIMQMSPMPRSSRPPVGHPPPPPLLRLLPHLLPSQDETRNRRRRGRRTLAPTPIFGSDHPSRPNNSLQPPGPTPPTQLKLQNLICRHTEPSLCSTFSPVATQKIQGSFVEIARCKIPVLFSWTVVPTNAFRTWRQKVGSVPLQKARLQNRFTQQLNCISS